MKGHIFSPIATITALLLLAACQEQTSPPVNTTPLPSVAAPPYICDYIPLGAVQLMTGIREPIVKGNFDLTVGKELDGKNYGTGGCWIYQPTGNKSKVLQISLSPAGSKQEVEWEISQGAKPLPEIIPGAIGHYSQDGSADNAQASAVLVHGLNEVIVDLIHGVKGRDNAADAAALMELIAPKLIPGATPTTEKTRD
ncbi:hypothetical protein ETD86_10990 [Nonomuraea turkmeniaca]|uniref:DUF3558 domain-containing protein n=1 Tax=Nonomuraea turkmeniaca TaxID=103838 RepID=A0A5S4FPY9_9ACTN|nr:hypothetical protein [Nonomuraea turkmeniaca]TMR22649.1 hypothetical protein ETD86_10990 [Nonomuraea turkmeniaca]